MWASREEIRYRRTIHLDSVAHGTSCLGFDAKLLEESSNLKRSIYNSDGVDSSVLVSSEEKSKSKFERYLKLKKEAAPKKKKEICPNSPKASSRAQYRREVKNLESEFVANQ